MNLDQEICLCFHVTRRKIEQFLRLQQPQRAGQIAECFGAGTGCGWCRQYLVAMFEAAQQDPDSSQDASEPVAFEMPDEQQYAEMRRQYRQAGRTARQATTDESQASNEE